MYRRDERVAQWDRFSANSRSWLVDISAGVSFCALMSEETITSAIPGTELYLVLFDNKGEKAQSDTFNVQRGRT